MSRLPIRVRLTAAFALAMLVVLAAAGAFVYLRLRSDLNSSLDSFLRSRAQSVASGRPGTGEEREDAFAQRLGAGGRVVAAAGGARGAVLSASELRRARERELIVDRRVPGIDGQARVLARPGAAGEVVVVGRSLTDRDETLSNLVTAFAIGAVLAALLAAGLGYVLAAAALAPVEAMRRRAAEVSLTGARERLPLPAAHDEIRRLGETLDDMLERLRRSFDRERRFVADASHELRTPIAVLKTELEGLLARDDLAPDAREGLAAAVDECDHLVALAEDLLVLSRAADGRLPVRPEMMAARTALEGARDRYADRAARGGRVIEVDAPAGLELSADPLRLRQALGNLVDNSLRHGAGEIALRARAAGGGAVELEVSDAGPGFPPGFGDRAFERFSRGERAGPRDGAGLGLAIVRAVAEAHGGSVAIGDGPGASVVMRLPRGALSAPSHRRAAASAPPAIETGGSR